MIQYFGIVLLTCIFNPNLMAASLTIKNNTPQPLSLTVTYFFLDTKRTPLNAQLKTEMPYGYTLVSKENLKISKIPINTVVKIQINLYESLDNYDYEITLEKKYTTISITLEKNWYNKPNGFVWKKNESNFNCCDIL